MAKRTIDTGKLDALGRPIKVSESALAGNINTNSRMNQIPTMQEPEVDLVADVVSSPDTINEIWGEIGEGKIDPGFIDSEQGKEFIDYLGTVNDEVGAMWSDGGEVLYDEDKWAEVVDKVGSTLDDLHMTYLDSQVSYDSPQDDSRMLQELSPGGEYYDTIKNSVIDEDLDDWDDFMETDEALDIMLDSAKDNGFLSCDDGGVIFDEDYFSEARDELGERLIEAYNEWY